MSGRLRIALAAQIAFFAVWGGYLATLHADAPMVWVATEPVDPRDLLSGHYVALRYRISSAAAAGCPTGDERAGSREVYVRLQESGETALTADGPVALVEAVACQSEPPSPLENERWIAGSLGAQPGSDRIVYGIERFYVPEASTLREARSGSVVARLAIAADHRARIVALVPFREPTTVLP